MKGRLKNWYYVALDITSNCICKIHWLLLDSFDLNTVHKLSSKEKKSLRSPDWSLGLMVGSKNASLALRSPPKD